MAKGKPAVAESNNDTVTVRVPITFRRRGGRRMVSTPDGPPTFAPARIRVNGPLVKAIARAFRWRRLLEGGVHTTVAEIAAHEKINASYVGRVLRLTLLAPDIIEAALTAQLRRPLTMHSMMIGILIDWNAQRLLLEPDPAEQSFPPEQLKTLSR